MDDLEYFIPVLIILPVKMQSNNAAAVFTPFQPSQNTAASNNLMWSSSSHTSNYQSGNNSHNSSLYNLPVLRVPYIDIDNLAVPDILKKLLNIIKIIVTRFVNNYNNSSDGIKFLMLTCLIYLGLRMIWIFFWFLTYRHH